HLAAVYDLSVAKDFAFKVNVTGTKNIISLALKNKASLHYVSTCYVSGNYPGIFSEGQLVEGQTFHNYYEETKYLAEVAVQEAIEQGLIATIYRPGIVVGHSLSGETQKFDGPYYIFQ